MEPDSRVFVAGHRGLVGSAIVRRLQAEGMSNVLTAGRDELDLRSQSAVNRWMEDNRPDYVFLVTSASARTSRRPMIRPPHETGFRARGAHAPGLPHSRRPTLTQSPRDLRASRAPSMSRTTFIRGGESKRRAGSPE